MARRLRVFLKGVPQNILIRGVAHLNVFKEKNDYQYAYNIFKELSVKIDISIHSFIFMPDHIHLLCTPSSEDSIKKFMQIFGGRYVRYYNKKYDRKGTLWEDRYKSSLVQDSLYLLNIMGYIELNPMRDGLVKDLAHYKWSSFVSNALDYNENDELITPHHIYNKLGKNKSQRAKSYLTFLQRGIDKKIIDFIRFNINKQSVTGSAEFCRDLESVIGVALKARERGRPKKGEGNSSIKNSIYKNLVVLDSQKHSDLKIEKSRNFSFTKNLQYIRISAQESIKIKENFPIVFTDDENSQLIALLSIGGENLAIKEDGKWICDYLPSILQNYPFSLAPMQNNEDEQLILIDVESDFVNTMKGESVFDKNQKPAKILQANMELLKVQNSNLLTTQNIIKEIKMSNILENREISIGEGTNKKVLVNGFLVVNKEKLEQLSDKKLALWVRSGIISMIENHLSSLLQIQNLFSLASKKQQI